MLTVSAIEIAKNLDHYFIVDIRERYEYEFANTGNLNIPMNELVGHLVELPINKYIVLMCKSGNRALALCNLLTVENGIENLRCLEGGIESWKLIVSPNLYID